VAKRNGVPQDDDGNGSEGNEEAGQKMAGWRIETGGRHRAYIVQSVKQNRRKHAFARIVKYRHDFRGRQVSAPRLSVQLSRVIP
jgi:hypothetical protein